MLTLYGTSRSRAARSIVALEEFGLEYRHIPLKPVRGSEDRERLARLNPNGQIPGVDDDGLSKRELIRGSLGKRFRCN